MDATELVNLVAGTFITDARINWNTNCSNAPEIYCEYEGELPKYTDSELMQIGDGVWAHEHDSGLIIACARSGSTASCERTLTVIDPATSEVHEETVTVLDLSHKVNQMGRYYDPVVGISFTPDISNSYRVRTQTVRVGLAREILDKYVYGKVGSNEHSYWRARHRHRDSPPWHDRIPPIDDPPEVTFVPDNYIEGWHELEIVEE